MMATSPRLNELMKRGREFAARRALTLERKLNVSKETEAKIARGVYVGLGGLSSLVTGLVETRMAPESESGQEQTLTLFSLELPYVVGTAALAASVAFDRYSEPLSYVAAAQLGLGLGTMGRRLGISSRQDTARQPSRSARPPASTAGVGALRGYGGHSYENGMRRSPVTSGDNEEWTAEEASLLGL